MLFREVLPSSGKVIVNGHDLVKMTDKEIPYFRRQLGIVFQDYRLLPDRTVYDNVAFAMQVIETPYRKIKRRVNDVLDLVGLRKRAHAYPTELSGGEQQMLAVGRAMMTRPRLIMMDEPSLGLAPLVVKDIFGIIRRLNETGTTILLIEQNANAALHAADLGYVMETGTITITGTGTDLLENEAVQEAYLGKRGR